MADKSDPVMTLLILVWLAHMCISASGQGDTNYVRDACSVTRYPKICIHSLASFSSTAKRNPTTWARAGVSVTIGEAKRMAQYLMKLKRHGTMRGRNQVALSDCVECFQDTIDNLYRSLGIIRKLNGREFYAQMSDVTTWLSAALTDEYTCLDGFDGQKGKLVELLRHSVSSMTCITSNALALVNRLATTGPSSLISP